MTTIASALMLPTSCLVLIASTLLASHTHTPRGNIAHMIGFNNHIYSAHQSKTCSPPTIPRAATCPGPCVLLYGYGSPITTGGIGPVGSSHEQH